jgi:hypothetical protein
MPLFILLGSISPCVPQLCQGRPRYICFSTPLVKIPIPRISPNKCSCTHSMLQAGEGGSLFPVVADKSPLRTWRASASSCRTSDRNLRFHPKRHRKNQRHHANSLIRRATRCWCERTPATATSGHAKAWDGGPCKGVGWGAMQRRGMGGHAKAWDGGGGEVARGVLIPANLLNIRAILR